MRAFCSSPTSYQRQTMTANYYATMLETDTFPQIEARAPSSGGFYWQQDLASSHTANATKNFLSERDIKCLPWLPSGADLSPLDIYVNPALKDRLRGKDLTTNQKLMKEVSKAPSQMGADPDFLKGLRKCCKSIKKRAKWVVAHNGRTCTSNLVTKWAQEEARTAEDHSFNSNGSAA